MSDLLHDALLRAQQQADHRSSDLSTRLAQTHLESDDELITVQTPSSPSSRSIASTPSGSRSTSPTRSGSTTPTRRKAGGGSGKPRRDKTKEREKEKANENKRDPIGRFPGEVNARIFGRLGVEDLLSVGLVCKRWRKSQTINWAWYSHLQSITYHSSSASPVWRKSDSEINWSQKYAEIHRPSKPAFEVDEEGRDVDEEGRTFKEVREEKWAEENDDSSLDKVEMRKYYKGLRNAKVKGKTGKGMTRTWDEDGLGGGGDDYV